MLGACISAEQKLGESFSLQSRASTTTRGANPASTYRTRLHTEDHRPPDTGNCRVVHAIFLSSCAGYLWPLENSAENLAMLAIPAASRTIQRDSPGDPYSGT